MTDDATDRAAGRASPAPRDSSLLVLWRHAAGRAGLVTFLLLAAAGALTLRAMRTPCIARAEHRAATFDGFQSLKSAATSARAREVVERWSAPEPAGCGTALAEPRRSLRFDYLFIAIYTLALLTLVVAVAERSRTASQRIFSVALLPVVLLAALLDVIENVALARMLDRHFGSLPAIASGASAFKLALIAGIVLYVLVLTVGVAWRRVLRRRSTEDGYPPWNPPSSRPQTEATDDATRDALATSVPLAHDALPGAKGAVASLDGVRDSELQYIAHHRHPGRKVDAVRESLVGLAMSGGGIRSATTNLGTLQALAELRILPLVDYVCTVSGGGYIGSCMSSLLSMNAARLPRTPDDPLPSRATVFAQGDEPAFGTDWERFPFRSDHHGIDEHDTVLARRATGLVDHLRTHGTFLVTRRGLATRDTMRALGTLLTGISYNLAGFLLVLTTATLAYLAAAQALAPGMRAAFHGIGTDSSVSVAEPVVGGAPPTVVARDSTRTLRRSGTCADADSTCVDERVVTLEPATLSDGIAHNLGVLVAPLRHTREDGTRSAHGLALAASALMGVVAVILGLVVTGMALAVFRLTGGFLTPLPGESREESLDRGVLLLLTGVTTATIVGAAYAFAPRAGEPFIDPHDGLVALWIPFVVLAAARITTIAVALVMTQLAPHTWSILPPRFRVGLWTRRFRSLWGAYQGITIYGIWIATGVLLLAPIAYAAAQHTLMVSLTSVGALGAARLLTPGVRGTSRRWRLPRPVQHALLGMAVVVVIAAGAAAIGSVVLRREPGALDLIMWMGTGVLLIMLLGFFVDHNKLGPHYFYRDRIAETYLLSELRDEDRRLWTFRDSMEMPLHHLHGEWRPRDASQQAGPKPRNPAPYHLISAAINLGGSRDLTRKDRKSGYWLFSKLYCGSVHTGFRPTARFRRGETKLARAVAISGAAASSGMGMHTYFAQAFATVLFNVRLGYWLENPSCPRSAESGEGGVFWPAFLWREVTMRTNERSDLVNLSDGGHTGDNVGIYPLLQRRCQVIIACDAEADAGLAFGSFTEALRHAYIDEGITVDIDLSMIRPDAQSGRSRSHCAVGRIYYPDRPHQVSYLVYLKNSLTGDEPEPVLNYKAACNDFPHESTVDQFFDDAQFESYRSLGVHIVKSTFSQWAASFVVLEPQQAGERAKASEESPGVVLPAAAGYRSWAGVRWPRRVP